MNIIYNETFSPVGLNIYMTIKNILRLDNIEDTDFIRGEIKRVNALQKDLPEENADELDAFMENMQVNSKKELMRTKHCIKYALNMCKTPETIFLKDEKGNLITKRKAILERSKDLENNFISYVIFSTT